MPPATKAAKSAAEDPAAAAAEAKAAEAAANDEAAAIAAEAKAAEDQAAADAAAEAAAANEQATAELTVNADGFIGGDAALAVPFSGLLADDPALREAEFTRDEWQQLLDDYLKSPRP